MNVKKIKQTVTLMPLVATLRALTTVLVYMDILEMEKIAQVRVLSWKLIAA